MLYACCIINCRTSVETSSSPVRLDVSIRLQMRRDEGLHRAAPAYEGGMVPVALDDGVLEGDGCLHSYAKCKILLECTSRVSWRYKTG